MSIFNIVAVPHKSTVETFCLIDWGEAETIEETERLRVEGKQFAVTWLFAHPSLCAGLPRSFDTDAFAIVLSLIWAGGHEWDGLRETRKAALRNAKTAYNKIFRGNESAAAAAQRIVDMALQELEWKPGAPVTPLVHWLAQFGKGGDVPTPQSESPAANDALRAKIEALRQRVKSADVPVDES